jgi:hypothetical protein
LDTYEGWKTKNSLKLWEVRQHDAYVKGDTEICEENIQTVMREKI